MGMKERTALAAFQVHKVLTIAGEKQPFKVAGHLKKGKYVHICLNPILMKLEGGGILKSADSRLCGWPVGEMFCLKLFPQCRPGQN